MPMTHGHPHTVAADPTASVGNSDQSAGAPSSHGTILLVEDDPMVNEIVSQLLASLGYEVIVASSSNDAVLEFRKQPDGIDIMLTDLRMPETNGPDLAETVCQISPGLKVIFMSGNLPQALTQDHTKHFLQKPFTLDELACKLAEVMQEPTSPTVRPLATAYLTLHLQPRPVL